MLSGTIAYNSIKVIDLETFEVVKLQKAEPVEDFVVGPCKIDGSGFYATKNLLSFVGGTKRLRGTDVKGKKEFIKL